MRWNEVWNMLIDYGRIAVIAAAAALLILWLARKLRGTSRRARKKSWQVQPQTTDRSVVRTVSIALLAGYLLALIAVTMLSRGEMSYSSASVQPFASYRLAWNTMELRQWQMIGLNILMFVPLGFLLPLVFPPLRKVWKTMAAGFCTTLIIETAQLLTSRGIFEFDDILNNVYGCLIGYCLIRILAILAEASGRSEMFSDYGKKERRRHAAAAAAVAISPLLLFAAVRFVYNQQEFGNLNIGNEPSLRGTIHWSEDAQSGADDSGLPQEAYVYSASILTEEEAQAKAVSLAASSGFGTDIVRRDVYNDNALFFFRNDAEETMSVWMYYDGGLYNVSFFDVEFDETAYDGRVPYSETAAKKLLKDATRITVPEGAKLAPSDRPGNYVWNVDQTENGSRGGKLGSLSLMLNADGQVFSVNNDVYDLTKVKQVELASAEQLSQRLRKGNYAVYELPEEIEPNADTQVPASSEPNADTGVSAKDEPNADAAQVALDALRDCDLAVTAAELTYQKDTKGFLRPMAKLTVVSDSGIRYRLLVRAEQ